MECVWVVLAIKATFSSGKRYRQVERWKVARTDVSIMLSMEAQHRPNRRTAYFCVDVCVPSAVVLPPGEHILEILFALTARTPSTSPTTTTFCRLQPRVCPLYSLWRVLLSLPSFLIVACLFSALRLRHTHTNIDNIDGAGRAHLIIETF